MKKKYRPLVIALACLVVVAGAYALILTFFPEIVEEKDPITPYETITPYELKDLDKVDFRFDDGYEYTIDLTHTSESNRNYTVLGKEEYDYDFTSISNACLSIATISTTRAYDEDAMDAAEYGLAEPRAFIDVYGTDGSVVHLRVGDPTRVGNYCYVQIEGDSKVYLVSGYSARYLVQTDYAYREMSVTNYTAETITTDIQSVDIAFNGEPVFGYHLATEEELEKDPNGLTVGIYMHAPINYAVNETLLTERLLAYLQKINATACIEDRPADLAKYGLDTDVTEITIENVDGSATYLKLSEPMEDGVRYGMIGGINSVYTFDAEYFSFLDEFSYDDVLFGLFWSYNIQSCRAAEVELEGELYRMEFFDPTDEEEEAGETFWATFNGEELREENCRGLFVRILSPTIYDLVPEDYEPEGDPYCVLRIENDEGLVHELELYAINQRQYAAYLRGVETGFLVKKDDINDIADTIEVILEGDLVPEYH